MSGEWAEAFKAAKETLQGASNGAARVGAAAAFWQVQVKASDRSPIVEDEALSLDASEAWLAEKVRGGFEGLLSFACLAGGESDRNRTLIAQAVDTRTRSRLQLSMAMRRTLTGKYKPVNGNAELEQLESLREEGAG
jgi:hypothetical protein